MSKLTIRPCDDPSIIPSLTVSVMSANPAECTARRSSEVGQSHFWCQCLQYRRWQFLWLKMSGALSLSLSLSLSSKTPLLTVDGVDISTESFAWTQYRSDTWRCSPPSSCAVRWSIDIFQRQSRPVQSSPMWSHLFDDDDDDVQCAVNKRTSDYRYITPFTVRRIRRSTISQTIVRFLLIYFRCARPPVNNTTVVSPQRAVSFDLTSTMHYNSCVGPTSRKIKNVARWQPILPSKYIASI